MKDDGYPEYRIGFTLVNCEDADGDEIRKSVVGMSKDVWNGMSCEDKSEYYLMYYGTDNNDSADSFCEAFIKAFGEDGKVQTWREETALSKLTYKKCIEKYGNQ